MVAKKKLLRYGTGELTMRSYRKRQIVKIFKTARAKAKNFYKLRDIYVFKQKFEFADKVQGRAFGSILYYLHKIRKVRNHLEG